MKMVRTISLGLGLVLASGVAVGRPARSWPPPPSPHESRAPVSLCGHVVVREKIFDVPVPHARLEVRRDGRVVASLATDSNGQFALRQDLPKGAYDLALEPTDYEGTMRVFVGKGSTDVILLAKRRTR